MVVDIRVSWSSAASLDFRLATDNIPKMKLRLDRFTTMLMLIDEPPGFCSLTVMATLRVEVLGLSSRTPFFKGFSAALLEVGLFSVMIVNVSVMIVYGAEPTA